MSKIQQNTVQNRLKRPVVCNLFMSLYIFHFQSPDYKNALFSLCFFMQLKQYDKDMVAYKTVNSTQSPSSQYCVSPHSITATRQMHFFSQLNNS